MRLSDMSTVELACRAMDISTDLLLTQPRAAQVVLECVRRLLQEGADRETK